MKVKELINLLKHFNKDDEVFVDGSVELKEEYEDAVTGEVIDKVNFFFTNDFGIKTLGKGQVVIKVIAKES